MNVSIHVLVDYYKEILLFYLALGLNTGKPNETAQISVRDLLPCHIMVCEVGGNNCVEGITSQNRKPENNPGIRIRLL